MLALGCASTEPQPEEPAPTTAPASAEKRESDAAPGDIERQATQADLFGKCEAKIISQMLTQYDCVGFTAALGEDQGTTVEASLAAFEGGISKAVGAGTELAVSPLVLTVSGERVEGRSIRAKSGPGRPDTSFTAIAFKRGDAVRGGHCVDLTADGSNAQKCREILEFFVEFGWPVVAGAIDKRVGGTLLVRGRRLDVPVGCESEVQEFSGRILCDTVELRWDDVEDASNAEAILAQTADSYRAASTKTATEFSVACQVMAEQAPCVGLRTELDGGQQLVAAVSSGPDSPLFVSCAFKGPPELPAVCRQLLSIQVIGE